MGSAGAAAKTLQELTFSFVPSIVLNAAVRLGIADIIAGAGEGATLSAAEIGAHLSTTSSKFSLANLNRLLRFLVLLNIVRSEHEDGSSEVRYGLTPISQLLVSNTPYSLLPTVRMLLHKVFLSPWFYLTEAVSDAGADPFRLANDGKSAFELGKEDENINTIFNQAMAVLSGPLLDHVLPKYDGFKDVKTVADVGGGVGITLRKIIEYNPHIQGINFDLPNVVSTAPEVPGVTIVGGDMFKSVLKADVIFMKWILHDWPDESSIQILQNCHTSLPDGGKVVLIEQVVPPSDTDNLEELRFTAQIDLLMMAHTTGRERTAQEWQAVFSAARFSRVNITPFPACEKDPMTQYVIEGFK